MKLKLTGKPGQDLAFPDRPHLDRQGEQEHPQAAVEYARRAGSLRTASYYTKWKKIWSPSKNGDTWYPEEIRFYDEVEKANQTLVLIKAVDPNALPQNLFTKAWLESKSR